MPKRRNPRSSQGHNRRRAPSERKPRPNERNETSSKSGSGEADGSWRRVTPLLGAVPNWLIKAGAVATAIVAIVAAYRTFWPEQATGAARLSELRVDPNVKLAGFLDRSHGFGARGTASSGRTRFVVAGAEVAQAQPGGDEADPPAGGGHPDPPGGGRKPDPSGGEGRRDPPTIDTTTAPTPDTATTTTPVPIPPDAVAMRRDLRQQPPEVLELLEPGQTPLIQRIEMKPAGSPEEERKTELRAASSITGDPNASEEDLREALAGTRLVRRGPIEAVQPGGPDLLVPFGAVVRFRLEPEGYQGEHLEVRWSLFDARRRTRIPRRWLQDRLALRFTPRRKVDRVTEEFWVPLPKSFRGPFSVRVEVFDEEGVGLDSQDAEIP